MISRVADHCFWFGRYLERAESTARVLAVTQHLALDAELTPPQCWLPVIIALGQRAHFLDVLGDSAAGDGELVQRYMSFDSDNPTSLRRSISSARDNARSIREAVSLETWETINELHLWMGDPEAEEAFATNRYGFYRRIRQLAQLGLGLTQSTMLHDTPLDFIWLGVVLERIGQTARTVDVHHHALIEPVSPGSLTATHQVVATALWLSLLRACSGFEPFMKIHQGQVAGEAVARFLLFESRFPRSIRHCVHAAYARLCDIRPPGNASLPGGEAFMRLQALDSWIDEKAHAPLDTIAVHALLTRVVDEIGAICDSIGSELFGYGPPRSAPLVD